MTVGGVFISMTKAFGPVGGINDKSLLRHTYGVTVVELKHHHCFDSTSTCASVNSVVK